ncbi:hypothetical protein KIPB_004002 [Kipferlia bialata]|uniref:Uncharacterized protein n=1 Tax=Kipferlia bialata TaxID=797122 RepID=A0A9K3GHS8_9EUKA|nr:hypothetical protein KIPB_004002 [Kipferlia bialata]|eukprot:g4002.t1
MIRETEVAVGHASGFQPQMFSTRGGLYLYFLTSAMCLVVGQKIQRNPRLSLFPCILMYRNVLSMLHHTPSWYRAKFSLSLLTSTSVVACICGVCGSPIATVILYVVCAGLSVAVALHLTSAFKDTYRRNYDRVYGQLQQVCVVSNERHEALRIVLGLITLVCISIVCPPRVHSMAVYTSWVALFLVRAFPGLSSLMFLDRSPARDYLYKHGDVPAVLVSGRFGGLAMESLRSGVRPPELRQFFRAYIIPLLRQEWMQHQATVTAMFACISAGAAPVSELTVALRSVAGLFIAVLPRWWEIPVNWVVKSILPQMQDDNMFSAFHHVPSQETVRSRLVSKSSAASPYEQILNLLGVVSLCPSMHGHDIKSMRTSILMGSVYQYRLRHPEWPWELRPLPHYMVDPEATRDSEDSFFVPRVHWVCNTYSCRRTHTSGLCARSLINGKLGPVYCSEDMRSLMDSPPYMAPTDHSMFTKHGDPNVKGCYKIWKLDTGLLVTINKMKRFHFAYFPHKEKILSFYTAVCAFPEYQIKLGLHELTPTHIYHGNADELGTFWQLSFIQPILPCPCGDIDIPSLYDYDRFREEGAGKFSDIDAFLQWNSDSTAFADSSAYPVTRTLQRISSEFCLMSEIPECCLGRILMAAEPLIAGSASSEVTACLFLLRRLRRILMELRLTPSGASPHRRVITNQRKPRSWFGDSASLALLVAGFFSYVDRIAMSDATIAALNHPAGLMYPGDHVSIRHSCSLFLLLDQLIPIRGFYPCFREFVRDIMIGTFHGFDMGFTRPRIVCHSQEYDLVGEAFVTLSDPGATTTTGVTLRLLLGTMLKILRKGYLCEEWEVSLNLATSIGRRQNMMSIIEHRMCFLTDRVVIGSRTALVEWLKVDRFILTHMCEDLSAFVEKCVPDHRADLVPVLKDIAAHAEVNAVLYDEWAEEEIRSVSEEPHESCSVHHGLYMSPEVDGTGHVNGSHF